jgi:hypothetical protein
MPITSAQTNNGAYEHNEFPFLFHVHFLVLLFINIKGTFFSRLQRTFNKKSGRWNVYPVKEKKKYTHVSSKIVLQKRLEDREGLQERMVLEVGDPRRISKSIAPISPPRTEQLAQEKKSRFKD